MRRNWPPRRNRDFQITDVIAQALHVISSRHGTGWRADDCARAWPGRLREPLSGAFVFHPRIRLTPPRRGPKSRPALRSGHGKGALPLACGSPRSIWSTGMYKGLDQNRIKEDTPSALPVVSCETKNRPRSRQPCGLSIGDGEAGSAVIIGLAFATGTACRTEPNRHAIG